MKPIHVVSDCPELFAGHIREGEGLGVIVTAGPAPDSRAKYIVTPGAGQVPGLRTMLSEIRRVRNSLGADAETAQFSLRIIPSAQRAARQEAAQILFTDVISAATPGLPRVLHFFPWRVCTYSGSQRLMAEWCQAEAGRFDIHVALAKPTRPVHDLSAATLHETPTRESMVDLIRTLDPDVVVNHNPADPIGQVVPASGRVAWYVHLEALLRQTCPTWCTPMAVLTNYPPEDATMHASWQGAPFSTVRLGVDLERFRPVDNPGADLVCGIVGRICADKVPTGFVETLKSWDPGPWRIRFIGRGIRSSHQEWVCRQLAGLDWIEFVGDVLPDDMPAEYAHLDALLVPSTTETGSYAIAEAMACGLPVVARAVGGIPYTAGAAATLCTSDGQLLAGLRGLDQPEPRAMAGRSCRTWAVRELDLRRQVREQTEAYTAASPQLADTALIIAYCYEDERRHAATLAALSHLAELDPRPCLHFADLSYERHADIATAVEGIGGVYHYLQRRAEHDHLFHKEDIYNLVLSRLPERVRCMLFLDADTWPREKDWAGRARETILAAGDRVMFQPWSEFADTVDSRLSGMSMAKRHAIDGNFTNHANPGLSVGMTRACCEAIGGFPLSCPAGAGDTMLMMEVYEGYDCGVMHAYPYFDRAMRRGLPQVTVRHIEAHMVHEHHGTIKNRGYGIRHQLLQAFWPFGEDLYPDADGLLCIRPGSAFQRCMARRRGVEDADGLAALFREEGIDRPVCCCIEDYRKALHPNRNYWTGRWPYFQAASAMLWSTEAHGRFLEVGPHECPLIRNAEYMDLWGNGVPATIHDAGEAPWPYPDGHFAAVAALQVIEHLEGRQDVFFREAARVAEWILVSLPWQWTMGEDGHTGIDWEVIDRWTGGARPREHCIDASIPTHRRLIALYHRDDLSSPEQTTLPV